MSYQLADFISQVQWISGVHYANPNRATELNAIAAALATDPTTHDATIETPPVGLQPGNVANTHFTNAVLEVVNRGKGGNLRPVDMGNAITAELSEIFAPVNTSPPVISGTATVGSTLTSTVGNWTYVPTSYAYQWLRGGTTMIAGATASTYTLAAADSGQNISMRLTATNAAGSTPIVSNAIAVA
jgi:hypothetical protein